MLQYVYRDKRRHVHTSLLRKMAHAVHLIPLSIFGRWDRPRVLLEVLRLLRFYSIRKSPWVI